MNWDQKLIDENEALGGTTDLLMDHAIAGAHWMRRQLRTDEAVERVAEGMQEAADHFGHYTPWADLPECVREDWRKPARAAITALLGPDHTTHHERCGCA